MTRPSAESIGNRIVHEIIGIDEDHPGWDRIPAFITQELRAYANTVLEAAVAELQTLRNRYHKVKKFRDVYRGERDSAREANRRLNRRWQETEARLRSTDFRGPPHIGALVIESLRHYRDENYRLRVHLEQILEVRHRSACGVEVSNIARLALRV